MDILWYYFYCSDDNRCLGEGAMFDYIEGIIYKKFKHHKSPYIFCINFLSVNKEKFENYNGNQEYS